MKNKHSRAEENSQFDVVVVGSGPSGVHAAYPLIKAGLKVAMVDGGLDSNKQDDKQTFLENDISNTSNAYDLLKKNSYVFNKTYQLLKIKSEIEIIQSLAKGGLSEIWHGICDYFSKEELERVGLPSLEIQKEYEEIAKRIRLTAKGHLDLHSALLLESVKNRAHLASTAYQAFLAFPLRTSSLIEDFKQYKNFTYIPNQVVRNVNYKMKRVEIQSFSLDTLRESTILSRYVVLAAGSINTTRILMRSLNLFNYRTTFLTKAHYMSACWFPRMIFKKNNLKKARLGQVAISSKETQQGLGTFFIQLYKFNPSSLRKALKYIPLPKMIGLRVLSFIAQSLIIVDIRFPALESKGKFSLLRKKKDEDILEISFQESEAELASHKNELRRIAKQLRSLGLFPIKTVSDYATAHYAGGVPFAGAQVKLSTDKNGKLHQASRIYVADSSTWRSLPAKPPTLTIMANASRVGKNVLRIFH